MLSFVNTPTTMIGCCRCRPPLSATSTDCRHHRPLATTATNHQRPPLQSTSLLIVIAVDCLRCQPPPSPTVTCHDLRCIHFKL
ncbi:hypothetical protein KFK09_011133 [Dendrobium nobile]|uniref:Uncharacterized protein n=1 Tax=Dendrobium nobile TaxID=94219 RepID=A0A8T3BBV6_DENNO|nr:hypothetical protein KFK09_011133 [Dendrobium nobile]